MDNHTTGRIESQHSLFKYNLGSGNSSFDTLFKRVHAQITIQQSKIQQARQKSTNIILRSLHYQWVPPLYRHVSIHVLELLMLEHNRMIDDVQILF